MKQKKEKMKVILVYAQYFFICNKFQQIQNICSHNMEPGVEIRQALRPMAPQNYMQALKINT